MSEQTITRLQLDPDNAEELVEAAFQEAELERQAQGLRIVTEEEVDYLDNLLSAVEELDPEAKSRLIKKIIAQNYGIESEESLSELIPYKTTPSEMESIDRLIEEFPKKIEAYQSLEQELYHKRDRKNLATLAKAGILPTDEAKIYLTALDRIHKALDKDSLKNSSNEDNSQWAKSNKIVFLSYCIPSTIAGVVTYQPQFLWVALAALLQFVIFIDGTTYSNPNEQRYNEKLAKHIQRDGFTIYTDLEIAQEHARELLGLVQNPTSLNADYKDKTAEIKLRSSQARKYLTNSIKLIGKIKETS